MKLRLADYGLGLTCASALFIFGAWGINYVHAQGRGSAVVVEEANATAQYLNEVKKDLSSGTNWNISLGVDEGKSIGDLIGVPKPGTLGPRTVKVIPLPGKDKAPDQIYRVDQTTGLILQIYSRKQTGEPSK